MTFTRWLHLDYCPLSNTRTLYDSHFTWEETYKLKEVAAAAAAKSLQSCPTLCNPIDGSPPGSPVLGILLARTLEWVVISFSNAWRWKVKVKSLSHVQLSDPVDYSLPGSSVHGIFQARVPRTSQSKPQSVAETGYDIGPPVHISTLSYSLYLTHAFDFPYSLCPRSGTNPWDNRFSKCRSQLEL